MANGILHFIANLITAVPNLVIDGILIHENKNSALFKSELLLSLKAVSVLEKGLVLLIVLILNKSADEGTRTPTPFGTRS